jgi:hypothetical protein
MSVNHTVVPRIDRAELAEWNDRQERARAAYDEEPHGYSRAGSRRCRECAYGRHHYCNTQAWPPSFDRPRVCSCWLDDHERAAE